MAKSVILHSGGIDSTVCLALAAEQGECISLSINYGQKHSGEVLAASKIAKFYGAEHIVIDFPEIFSGAGSTLIDPDAEIPHLSYEEIRESKGPSPTYVPFRNGNFLSVATAIAMTRKASYVWFGAHKDDSHNDAYPDCSPLFISNMAAAIDIGSYNYITLFAPLQDMTKAEIIKLGDRLNIPFELTVSCYNYDSMGLHCKECPTCVSREAAFEQANIFDPTAYKVTA
jgi:7-cyano-7-deazaguanine synthase